MEFLLIVFKSALIVFALYLLYLLFEELITLCKRSYFDYKNNKEYGEVSGTIISIKRPNCLFTKYGFLYREVCIEKYVNGKRMRRTFTLSLSEYEDLKVGQKIKKEKNKITVID